MARIIQYVNTMLIVSLLLFGGISVVQVSASNVITDDKIICPSPFCAAPPSGCRYVPGTDAAGCPTCGELDCKVICPSPFCAVPPPGCRYVPGTDAVGCPTCGTIVCGQVCGNGVCEEGEAESCPSCEPGEACPVDECRGGTCPTDCHSSCPLEEVLRHSEAACTSDGMSSEWYVEGN